MQTSLSLAFAILSEAALSFLGLGIQPPQPSLGRMIFDSQGFVTLAWWMAVFPGAAIFVIVLAFNLLGDGLRDVLDPKQRTMIEARRQAVSRARPERARPAGAHRQRARSSAACRSTSHREQTLGIVGESGSGKSMTVLAATGLLDAPGRGRHRHQRAWPVRQTAADAARRRIGHGRCAACTAAGSGSCSRIRGRR